MGTVTAPLYSTAVGWFARIIHLSIQLKRYKIYWNSHWYEFKSHPRQLIFFNFFFFFLVFLVNNIWFLRFLITLLDTCLKFGGMSSSIRSYRIVVFFFSFSQILSQLFFHLSFILHFKAFSPFLFLIQLFNFKKPFIQPWMMKNHKA